MATKATVTATVTGNENPHLHFSFNDIGLLLRVLWSRRGDELEG